MISYSFYKRVNNFIKKQMFKLLFSSRFKHFGKNVGFISPDNIQGEEYIEIKKNTMINSMAWFLALKETEKIPKLIIDENVYIGRFSHIVCINEIIIEKNVLMADKVYISDNIHEYKDINLAVKEQPIKFVGEVRIGENSWLGENVSILGASIGKHCIIGSNSMVNNDIPEYCVAVGTPAKIIKRYCKKTDEWRKANSLGEFI